MVNFNFDDFQITLDQGGKAGKDYILKYDNTQFNDRRFFSDILNAFDDEDSFISFINYIRKSNFLTFSNTQIDSPCIGLSDLFKIKELYTDISNTNFSSVQKGLLFLSILRIDIDNICYPPSKFNGGIRHFIQLLLLGGIYFNLDKYTKELGFNKDATKIEDIPKFISDIGFPRNSYNITTNDFKNYYSVFMKK